MEESVFAPYSNRNSIKIAGCFPPDTLVYGSAGNVVVIRHNAEGASLHAVPSAHDWVNGLTVASERAPSHLARTFATCGKDGFVRLWNVDTLSIVKAHKTHLSQKGEGRSVSVSAVAWSESSGNVVISVAENSCLVVWHLTENVTYKISIREKIRTVLPMTIALHPSNDSIIALGSGGLIHVLSVEQGSLRKQARLRAFTTSVIDLAWQPSNENPLLATTSKYGELSLWDTASEKCVKTWRLAEQCYVKPGGGGGDKENISPGSKYPLLWLGPATLLTRSGPALVAFDCSSPEAINASKPPNPWKKLCTPHYRDFQSLFKSCAPGERVWTIGSDRKIVESELGDGAEIRRSICLMNGGNVCMAVSPHDPQLLALAGQDATVRLWNVTKPTGTALTQFKQVLDKVMSLCWHYKKENTLLFGTLTGRIGVMEGSKQPRMLPQCSSRQVYWMCWGPPPPAIASAACPSAEPHYVLYVVTNKKLFVYKDIYSNEEAVDLSEMMALPASGVTDVTWKPDMSTMAVGGKHGEISIYDADSLNSPALTIKLSDSVQYLSWHPEMTTSEKDVSVCRDLFTCGSYDSVSGVVPVYFVARSEDGCLAATVKASLKGHTDSVQSVAWSPHVSGQLVTASLDGTARIWNVLNETVLFIYDKMLDRKNWLTIWHPVHSDYIISSTSLGTVVTWKISGKTSKHPAELKPSAKRAKKIKHSCEVATEEGEGAEEKATAKKENAVEPKTSLAELVPSNKKGEAGCLEKCWEKAKQDGELVTCHRLLKAAKADRQDMYSFALFASAETMEERLAELEAETDGMERESMMVWRGQLKEHVEKRIAEGTVSDRIVALAASVSPRLWYKACLAAAQQFRIAAKFNQAASYFVAAGSVHQAVEVLLEGKLWEEAVCLARCHLPDDDPAISEVCKAYAQHLISKGSFARAAECLIYVDEYEAAADCLGKHGGSVALSAAALAARHAANPQKEEEFALSAFAHHSIHPKGSDYDCQFQLMDIPSLQLLQAVTDLMQSLDGPESSTVPLLDSLKDVVAADNLVACHQQLLRIAEVKTTADVEQHQIHEWKKVHELALAVTAANDRVRSQHLLRALEAANQQSAAQLCALALKLSPGLQVQGLFAKESPLGTSLRAFVCLALLHKAGINAEEGKALLPRIAALTKDLLHEKAFTYHRARCQLPLKERLLSQLAVSGQEVILRTQAKDVDTLTNGVASLSCNDKDCSESSQNSPSSMNCRTESSDENSDVGGNPEESNGCERNQVPITKLIEERNELVITISRVEAERTVVPNPVMGLSLLRNYFQEHSDENALAKENLDLIVGAYLPLIQ